MLKRNPAIVVVRAALAGALLIVALPAAAEDAFTAAVGASNSRFAPESVFGELNMIGVTVDARLQLPFSMYGQLQVRSEDGDGIVLGETSHNDYLRFHAETGFEIPLWWKFVGNVGLNYVQSDLDVGAQFGDQQFTVGINREGFGGRVGLARRFGSWVQIRAESEYSPVEEAIGGVFDVEVGPRPWVLALKYDKYFYSSSASVMLRYHFVHRPDPEDPPPPEPRVPVPIPPHLAPAGRVLQLQPELMEAPPPRPAFVPPPGCEPNDFEVLSPRCDPPYFPLVPGEPEWKNHPMPE